MSATTCNTFNTMISNIKGKFYTYKKISETFDIDRITIWRYVRAGKLKAIKFGSSVRFAEKDILEFIDKYTPKNKAASPIPPESQDT